MKEYIEKYAAEKAIRNDLPLSTWMKRSVDKAAHAMGVTIAAIDAIPAADVVEVRHGRWKDSDFISGMLTCTSCGAQRNPKFKIGGGKWNYCPNCGAKMDGGADDAAD